MKYLLKYTINLMIILLYISASGCNAKSSGYNYISLKIQPEKPEPGETISITYNPTGSRLENAEKISAIVYAYGSDIYYTNEIKLKKNSSVWTGEFSVADTCAGVVLRFTDGNNYDNNGSKCYPIRFYARNGKYVKNASAGLAAGYMNWVFSLLYPLGESDSNLVCNLFKEEFLLYPQQKRNYLLYYYRALSKIDKNEAAEFLKEQTEFCEKTLTQSYEDLCLLLELYKTQDLKDKITRTNTLILEKYPLSSIAEEYKYRDIYKVKDELKRTELKNEFRIQFPKSAYLKSFFLESIKVLTDASKYKEALDLINKKKERTSEDYNGLAWTMYEKDVNLTLAKEIALKGIGLLDTEKQTWLEKCHPLYTKDQYKEVLDRSYGKAIMDTYGAILLKLGENKEALKYMTKAYKGYGEYEWKVEEVYERYTQALLVNGKNSDALEVLEKFISSGNSTAKMKEMLRQAYAKVKGSETGFDKYLADLESKAKKTAPVK